MTEPITTPRPRLQAPASAVAASSGAAFDEALALTKALKLPNIRREIAFCRRSAVVDRCQDSGEFGEYRFHRLGIYTCGAGVRSSCCVTSS